MKNLCVDCGNSKAEPEDELCRECIDKTSVSAVASNDGVIKPDDCCHLCKGGWCTDETAALTCKDALLPDDYGETIDHSGVGCQRAL